MRHTLLAVLVALLLPMTSEASERATPKELTEYIRESYLKGAKKDERWHRAPELSRLIVNHSRTWDVNPVHLLLIAESESSLHEGAVQGKIGEIGLTQLHGAAARGVDLTTTTGQLWGGARWLRFCLDKCRGDLYSALQAYQTGSCSGTAVGPGIRMVKIRRAMKFILTRRATRRALTMEGQKKYPLTFRLFEDFYR